MPESQTLIPVAQWVEKDWEKLPARRIDLAGKSEVAGSVALIEIDATWECDGTAEEIVRELAESKAKTVLAQKARAYVAA